MATVVIFGAGLVARPIIRYLLDQPDVDLTVATMYVRDAEKLIDGHPSGTAKAVLLEDKEKVAAEIKTADAVVSLVPYVYHVGVAELCVEHRKHLVTTSYAGKEMRDLDASAREAGVLLLNECGLDPGVDHMSAMRIIHGVGARGGRVVSFKSSTGALPAHEANNNPFGYKITWSPRGVLLASKNPARWLEDGAEVNVPGERLFENYYIMDVPGSGSYENYPNRDSMPYKEIYGLDDAKTVYRGTLRMTGWCETLRKVVALGWLAEEPVEGFAGTTYGDMTRHFVGAPHGEDLSAAVAGHLGLEPHAAVIKRLEWLGLLGDKPLPDKQNVPLDCLNELTMEKLKLGESERDMIVMHHEFLAEFPDGKKEYITSTLVDYGVPGEDSAIARTVSLPAAYAARMVLDGKIKDTGTHIPVSPGIYNPILDELESNNVVFKERTKEV